MNLSELLAACGAVPNPAKLFETLGQLLLALVRLTTLAILLLTFWLCLRELLRVPGGKDYLNGTLRSPDLALQFVGSTDQPAGELDDIARKAGYLILLRNIRLDSRFFIPTYLIALLIATWVVIGLPCACGDYAFSPWSLVTSAMVVTAAVLDWLENAALQTALRQHGAAKVPDAPPDRPALDALLKNAYHRAGAKFLLLGAIFGMLARHAWPPHCLWPAIDPTPHLFAGAAVLLVVGRFYRRVLEAGITLAALSLAAFFLILAWR